MATSTSPLITANNSFFIIHKLLIKKKESVRVLSVVSSHVIIGLPGYADRELLPCWQKLRKLCQRDLIEEEEEEKNVLNGRELSQYPCALL